MSGEVLDGSDLMVIVKGIPDFSSLAEKWQKMK